LSIDFILGFGGQKYCGSHYQTFEVFSTFQICNLSIFGYFEIYSNQFLLKIETGLSLKCDMSLFFSGSHKCLKYLTKL
jgi:hypothetical protein